MQDKIFQNYLNIYTCPNCWTSRTCHAENVGENHNYFLYGLIIVDFFVDLLYFLIKGRL